MTAFQIYNLMFLAVPAVVITGFVWYWRYSFHHHRRRRASRTAVLLATVEVAGTALALWGVGRLL